jgi:thiamine-monophosphate kinase
MEAEFVRWLRERIAPSPLVFPGIGDDAAIVTTPRGHCVVSSDMLMDGVDFHLLECGPWAAGRKSLAVNLSDLAAMAARPLAALVSLALPRDGGAAIGRGLYEGLLELADHFGVAIAGGDTNSWSGPLVISVTVLGEQTGQGPLLRSGGRVGDDILLTGAVGGSLLGRHLSFRPRVQEAILLNDRYALHAGIDISDGLSLDLARLAEESQCGAEIDLEQIPVSEDARRLATADGRSALDHALADGEDFELLLAVAPETAARILADQPLDVPVSRIGRLVAERGLWQSSAQAGRAPLSPAGYEHQFQ